MKKILFLLFIVPCCLNALAQVQLPDSISNSIRQRIEAGHAPAIVVGIYDKDGPHYFSFGTATVNGQPVNEHSIFEIGSISKTFTGILLAQMELEGSLKTSDPVQMYLPSQVKMPMKDGESITLGHLSDHTSGLPRMPDNFQPKDPGNPYADYSVEQLYSFLNACSLPHLVGESYEYSNLAVGLLGHCLALKANSSYEALVTERICRPLGMRETAITLDAAMKSHLAPGHSHGNQVPNWDIPVLAGAGAIRSSLHDMLLYVAANLGQLPCDFYPALQRAHQARHHKTKQGSGVGLGWHIQEGAEGPVIWHNGGTGGYRTFCGFVKETGVGVVVLTNSDTGADDIGFKLLNSKAKLREVKKLALNELKNAMNSLSIEEAKKIANNLQKNKSRYEFNEEALNNLGYEYLTAGKLNEALILFKLIVDEFPRSSNAYDSYAEALMKSGSKEAAIEHYQKSLSFNPDNTNAIQQLAAMGVKWEKIVVQPDEATLQSYVGEYQLSPNFSIVISRSGLSIFAQATAQPKFELFPRTHNEFYIKDPQAEISFFVEEGMVKGLTLFQSGKQMPGRKIK